VPLKRFSYSKLIRNYDDRFRQIIGDDGGILSPIDKEYKLIVWPGMQDRLDVSDSKKEAVRYYLTHLHNTNIEETKSYYTIQSGLDLLEKMNIPYVFLPGPLKHLNWDGYSCWPNDKPQPWDYVSTDFFFLEGNHIPSKLHKEMVETLSSITLNWIN
jgi:hypothetical protein